MTRLVDADDSMDIATEADVTRQRPRRPLAEHGTRTRYRQGCRCAECRRANADYMRGYRATFRGGGL